MNKKISLFVLCVVLTTISGCSWLNKPYLYGNDSCNDKTKTAYVYSGNKAATCLQERAVAYILCAKELGVISHDSTQSLTTEIKAELERINVSGNTNYSDSLKTVFASEGELARARASALTTCVNIYNNYNP